MFSEQTFQTINGAPSMQDLLGRMPSGSLTPNPMQVARGLETLRYNKTPVVLSDYRVEVFDMMDKGDRDRYAALMKDLFRKVQNAQAVVSKQELQTIRKKDGSEGWQRYVEWFEYKLNDVSTTKKMDPKEKEDGEDRAE